MRNRTDLLNVIAVKIKAKTYLEIGVYNPDHNFNSIAVMHKVSVDPDPKAGALVRATSDDFFKLFPESKFDLIFIDGLHHADQVKMDLINAWDHLNPGGAIVMHDCNPPTEATTCVPRGSQREWCGDVYKVASVFDHPSKFTVDFDYGCTVYHRSGEGLLTEDSTFPNWDNFQAHKEEYLNLVSAGEAQKIVSEW